MFIYFVPNYEIFIIVPFSRIKVGFMSTTIWLSFEEESACRYTLQTQVLENIAILLKDSC